MDKLFQPTLYNECNCLSMMGLKLIHLSKRGPWEHPSGNCTDWSMLIKSWPLSSPSITLQWRHNDHDGVSNRQPHGCLLNRLFRRRSKKISKLRVTGLCVGNSPGPVNSPHKGPVTRKMFPFDDIIMIWQNITQYRVYRHPISHPHR